MHLSTSRAFVRSTLLTGLVLAPILAFGCSSERKLPESTGNSTDALAWKKILIRVPAERMGEFEEGGGLIQQVEPVDAVNGESGWWLARFPVVDIPVLEADGFEVRTLEAGLVNPQAQNGDACPVTYPVQEAFCGYHGGSLYSNCKRPIWIELGDAPTEFPPINGNTYVSVVDFPNVPEELRGVRIGKHSTSSTPVPQMVVFAAQHGNEWAGTEMSMRLFRFLAQSFRDDTNGVRSLLANVSILIIPVANPEGYQFAHTVANQRLWRKNRQPCSGGFGTDVNRNFGATRNQPGVVGTTCSETTFRGPSALSAPESVALLDVFADANLPGSYVTRFALNVHAYGNFVLFPEGLDNPTKFCSTIGNCTAPDFGILEKLLGSEQNTVLRDPETARPFVVGTSFRNLYPIAGDGMHPTFYGEPNRPDVPKFLSASLEVTHTECTFQAEAIPAAQFDASFEQFKQLNVDALAVLPNIASSSFLDNLILPHLHRRAVTGDGRETPTIRLAARPSLGPVTFDWPGTTEVDDVRDGVNYRMWRFRPDDPYIFPTEITVCVKGQCSTTTSPGEEKIDLCTPRFSGDSPWSFVGPDSSLSPDECYWHFDDSQVGQITSPKWSLADMYGAHLVFSHRNWSSLGSSTNIRVLVSNNGFQNCKPEPGTGCRIVREFPYGDSNFDVRSQFGFAGAYRTEILDISEYDHVDKMEVRFEVTKTGSKIDVFDAIIIGWKG